MKIVERQLLTHCVETLVNVQEQLRETPAERLAQCARSGKADSLYLDVLPETVLNQKLCRDFDDHFVLVTEEKGEFNFREISDAEIVIFADPTDRSKFLRRYIMKAIGDGLVEQSAPFREVLDCDADHSLWMAVDEEHDANLPPQISGACCAITVVKRGEILFSLILNYITEEIAIACEDYIAIDGIYDNSRSISDGDFRSWPTITFSTPNDQKSYVTYLAKDYEEHLKKSGVLDDSFKYVAKEPGGPARILYLSNLNSDACGFILSNGEKIGEWIGWLAFCRFCNDLVAYSVFPETFFAKDDVLKTPSPPYSVLEVDSGNLWLNYEKLRYLNNPSRYREMILVAHRGNNAILGVVGASKSRQLFYSH